jgi:hypothetical protein
MNVERRILRALARRAVALLGMACGLALAQGSAGPAGAHAAPAAHPAAAQHPGWAVYHAGLKQL